MLDKAVILASDSKKHQSKLTYNRPRTMLPALGKPLVVRVMDRLYRVGIRKYIVVLGEQDGSVAAYLSRRWLPDVAVEFVIKKETTSLGQTLSEIAQGQPEPLLIANYNSFTHGLFPQRIIKFHQTTPTDLILSGARDSLSSAEQYHYAHIQTQGKAAGYSTESRIPAEVVTGFNAEGTDEEQALVLTDFAVAGTNFVAFLGAQSDTIRRSNSLVALASAYLEHQPGGVRLARASWVLQVETDSDLITLNRYLLEEKIDAHILSEIPYTVRVREPVRIDPGVSIGQGATIGPYVYLETGCSVGHDAHLQNTIVLGQAVVQAKEHISNAIISTRGHIRE